jgi:hypothetical protein
MIIAGFWGQVEYRTKQLMPWKDMSRRPTPAAKSLLIDYISPWNVLVLFESLKAAHWIVAVSILGSLLIKFLAVVSTGLFMLQDVTVQNRHISLMAQSKFDGSNFDSARVDGNSALTVAGVMLLNLTYPPGTTAYHAFQPFNMSESVPAPGSELAGIIDVFSADIDCEIGTLKNWTSGCYNQGGCEQTQVWATVATPSCPGYRFPSFMRSTSGSSGGYFGNIYPAQCLSTPPGTSDNRLLIVSAHWVNDTMPTFTTLVCKPTYNITKGLVSLSGDGSVARITLQLSGAHSNAANASIPGVDPWDVALALNSSLNSAAALIHSASFNYYTGGPSANSTIWGTFFQLCNISMPQENASAFLDAGLLQQVSREVYSSVAAQVAKQNFLSSAEEPFSGTYSISEHRLFVRGLSLRLMEAMLALLIIIPCILCVLTPGNCTSRDPGSIGGLATILARSSKLATILDGTGTASVKVLKTVLFGKQYQTVASTEKGVSTFSVEPSSSSILEESRLPLGYNSAHISWWQPFAVTIWARILVLIIPVAVIAALEATYQRSAHTNGLATIHSEGYIRYTWVYIPALVMLGVRTLFDNIDFNAKIFQPYYKLRRAGGATQSSIMENHLSKASIYSLWSAMLKREYALLATGFAMLLASSLTIVVSGLYSAEDVNHARSASVRTIDSFNSTMDLANVDGATTRADLLGGLIVNSNLPYPSWTYDELAFPKLELVPDGSDNDTLSSNNDTRVLKARIPALRGGLTCKVFPANDIYYYGGGGGTVMLAVNAGVGCGDQGYVNTTLTNETFFFENLDVDHYFGTFQNAQLALDPLPGCPAMYSIYGHFTSNTTTDEIYAFKCNPHIDQVQVDTTFLLPGFKINETIIDESSATLFASNFTSQLDISNYLLVDNKTNDVFDPMFSGLLYGEKSITLADIKQKDHFPTLFNATQHLYRVLVAQSLNAANRIPDAKSNILPATIIDPYRVRLIQSPISTRILEGFLAAMFICAAVAIAAMDTREVLPKNPCSVAAGASLLAGAEMLHTSVIPPGSEWRSEKELRGWGVFGGGKVFGLRWWGGGEGIGKRRFGVDVEHI